MPSSNSSTARHDADDRISHEENRANDAFERLESMVIDLKTRQAATESQLIPERDALIQERDALRAELAEAKAKIASQTALINAISTRIDTSVDQLEKALAA